MKILSTLIATLLFLSVNALGQVMFKLELNDTDNTVSVLAVPKRTVNYPQEIVGSIQVTFSLEKESTFKFESLYSEIPNVNWMKNNVLDDVNYSSDRIYYTVGVEPIGKSLRLKKDQEVKLFSIPTGSFESLELLGLEETITEWVASNLSIDIANNLSLASTMGVINAYAGNIGEKNLRIVKEELLSPRIDVVYPNPGGDEVKITWSGIEMTDNERSLELLFIEPATGRKVLVHPLENKQTTDSEVVNISDLTEGNYAIVITDNQLVKTESYLFNKN